MAYRLEGFAGIGLSEALLELIIEEHRLHRAARFDLLWSYFRNPLEPVGYSDDREIGGVGSRGEPAPRPRVRYLPAQARGLPDRIVGRRFSHGVAIDDRLTSQREVVVENDIGWRVQTMVDFMFGRPVQIVSTAPEEQRRREIERVINAIWEASGGVALMQDMALLGNVFGTVDLALRWNERALVSGGVERLAMALASGGGEAMARLMRIETIDPRRGAPIVSPEDYRRLDGYVMRYGRALNAVRDVEPRVLGRWPSFGGVTGRSRGQRSASPIRASSEVTEIIGAGLRQVYEGVDLVREERTALLPGVVPIAHIQNLSQPLVYDGLSEVEPLVPIQDELNTRLSDRANRVTMQSFKMYLAKRLDGFERAPAGPGVVWSTDDPDASIESFGGDASSPSETEHIEQLREAMDKISAVPPLAGGVVRARIGNLSSATALRITLMSLLAKTARKRVSYGRGISEITRMALTALDAAGVLRTTREERGVRLIWPDPTPAGQREAVQTASAKLDLGVSRERVLDELGYAETDAGVV